MCFQHHFLWQQKYFANELHQIVNFYPHARDKDCKSTYVLAGHYAKTHTEASEI
jgi:hypothetical protein